MEHEESLAVIKQELERLDPNMHEDENDVGYRTGVLLLAAVFVTGADVEALTEFTGYSQDFVFTVSSRLRKYGIWDERGIVRSDHWFSGGSYNKAVFWADVLVGMGLVIAEPLENSQFRYRTISVDSIKVM